MIEHPKKTLIFDDEKAANLLNDLIITYQKYSPTISEILAVTSNLLYSLGASISPVYNDQDIGKTFEELQQLYYSEKGRMDVALMLEGLNMSTWKEDWEKSINGEK